MLVSGGRSWRLDDGAPIEDVAFSLQETIFAMLTEVSERALSLTGTDELVLGGTHVVGKDGEGDGTVQLPPDFAGSADLSVLRGDGATGAYVRILDEDYETFAEAAAADAEYTIVVGEDWKIIPLENLIARIGEETTLVAGVSTADEAKTAFETLERGADAVLLDSDDPDEIRPMEEILADHRPASARPLSAGRRFPVVVGGADLSGDVTARKSSEFGRMAGCGAPCLSSRAGMSCDPYRVQQSVRQHRRSCAPIRSEPDFSRKARSERSRCASAPSAPPNMRLRMTRRPQASGAASRMQPGMARPGSSGCSPGSSGNSGR